MKTFEIKNATERQQAANKIRELIEKHGGWSKVPDKEMEKISTYQSALYRYDKAQQSCFPQR